MKLRRVPDSLLSTISTASTQEEESLLLRGCKTKIYKANKHGSLRSVSRLRLIPYHTRTDAQKITKKRAFMTTAASCAGPSNASPVRMIRDGAHPSKQYSIPSINAISEIQTFKMTAAEAETEFPHGKASSFQPHEEHQYLDLIRTILDHGEHRPDR